MIKNIEFNNSKGEKIKGILKEKNSTSTLMIVCHGYKSSKNDPAIESITDKLYNMGDTTFSFNFSESAQGINLRQQVADINDIINFFNNYKDIIIIAGSFGSLSGVIAAIQSSKIKGIITVNGFFGSPQLGINLLPIYMFYRIRLLFNSFYRDNWNFLKSEYKPEKISVDTLIIHAKTDKDVSISQSKNFYKKVKGRKKFYIMEYGDHYLTREESRQETAIIIDKWLKKRK